MKAMRSLGVSLSDVAVLQTRGSVALQHVEHTGVADSDRPHCVNQRERERVVRRRGFPFVVLAESLHMFENALSRIGRDRRCTR